MPFEILDSSCWIEYFNDSPVGERFAGLVEEGEHLLDANFEGLPGAELITRDGG